MTGWIILGAVSALLLILLLMPLRMCFAFGESISLWVKLGPKRIVLLPGTKKEKPSEKPAAEAEPAEKKPAKTKKQRPKPTSDEIFDLLSAVWTGVKRLLKRMGRHLTIDPLECYATIGGPDPAQVAQRFGYANAVVGTVLPYLQATAHVPHPEVHIRMDFDAPRSTAEGRVGIRLTLFGVLRVSFGLAWPVLKWFLKFLRAAGKREKAARAAAQHANTPVTN